MLVEVNNIVIHTTATPKEAKVESILNYWKHTKGWRNPGYHFLIEANGRVNNIHPLTKPSNGVRGHNHDSIHLSYIGGIDIFGMPSDTRTSEQKHAMEGVVKALHAMFPGAEIKGHRDFEGVAKACPSFEVSEWLEEIDLTK